MSGNIFWRLVQQGLRGHLRGSSIAIFLLGLGVTGCANRRSPKPPTLRLPQPAHGLTAERVGDTVTLHWTTRPKTTDGDAIRGAVTAVVCRNDAPKTPPAVPVYPTPPDPCKEVMRVTVVPGDSEAKDVLPARLTVGSPSLILYRVQLLNDHGHGAESAAPVYALAGKAPAAAGLIHVEPRRNAVVVAWQPASGEYATMRVTRTLIATGAGPVVAKTAKSVTAAKKPDRPAGGSSAQLVLVGDGVPSGDDPGGMTDRTIHDGDTVTYTAQRVLTVRLAVPAVTAAENSGKTKPDAPDVRTFELRGVPSPEVMVTFHDVIPPISPVGLVAVAGGGFGEPLSIDLSWEANPELDVAGYNVYRMEVGSSSFRRVNETLVVGLAFRDAKVDPGKAYLYRVTAVDMRGHESAPGSQISANVKP